MNHSRFTIITCIILALTTVRLSFLGIDRWTQYRNSQIVQSCIYSEIQRFLETHEKIYSENVKAIQDSVNEGLLSADSAFYIMRSNRYNMLYLPHNPALRKQMGDTNSRESNKYFQITHENGPASLTFILRKDLGNCNVPDSADYKEAWKYHMAKQNIRWEINIRHDWSFDGLAKESLPQRDTLREPMHACYDLRIPTEGRCSGLFKNIETAIHSKLFSSCKL